VLFGDFWRPSPSPRRIAEATSNGEVAEKARPGPESVAQTGLTENPHARDIDLLWAGTRNAAAQSGNTEWMWPLARLGRRWRAEVKVVVPPSAYRKLLPRARLFLYDPAQARPTSALEAAAAGALVFQPHDCCGLPLNFRDREEFICYRPEELELLVELYLE